MNAAAPLKAKTLRIVGGLFALLLLPALTMPAPAQQVPPYISMGDSLTEGVQSKNAAWQTQVNSYAVWLARKMEVQFVLPYIQSDFLAQDGDMAGRSRILPYTLSPNLGIAGQKVGDLLRERADAQTPGQFDSEADLVLFHKQGSQIEIAEFWKPPMASLWIGANDILRTAIAFDKLDGSQKTPLQDFAADFHEVAQRMNAAGIQTIYANIPDIASIGFLLSPQDLVEFTGSDQGLPQGHFTTVIAMVFIQLGIEDSSLLQDPDWVLDPTEVQAIRDHLNSMNQIIEDEAAAVQAPVVDVNAIFNDVVANPPTLGGFTVTRKFTGGLFSMDGFHPSNTGQALVARAFIEKMNDAWMLNIPNLTEAELAEVAANDPYVDHDGDGQVQGRLGVGLFETVFFLLGFTGDFVESPVPAARRAKSTPNWDSTLFEQIVLSGDRAADRERLVDMFHALVD